MDRHHPRLLRPRAARPAAGRRPRSALRRCSTSRPPGGSPSAAYETALEAWAAARRRGRARPRRRLRARAARRSSWPRTRRCAAAARRTRGCRSRRRAPAPDPARARRRAARRRRAALGRRRRTARRWRRRARRWRPASGCVASGRVPWPGELDVAKLGQRRQGARGRRVRAPTATAWEAYRERVRRPPRARGADRCSTTCSTASAPTSTPPRRPAPRVDFDDLELRVARPARRPGRPRAPGPSGSS